MNCFRAFFVNNRRLAALLVAAALCLKAVVPVGYMIDAGAKVLTVHICADQIAGVATKQITIPMAGKGDAGGKGHADAPCPYASLSHAALGTADPLQLVLALAFILALGFLPGAPMAIRRFAHWHPPLRGPPATA